MISEKAEQKELENKVKSVLRKFELSDFIKTCVIQLVDVPE
jgi:hypothetical protein